MRRKIGNTPSDDNVAAAENATRHLLARFGEPEGVVPPPDLTAHVMAALSQRPAPPSRHPWFRRAPAIALVAAALLLLLSGLGLYVGSQSALGVDAFAASQASGRNPLTASLGAALANRVLQTPLLPAPHLLASVLGLALLAFSSAVAVVWPCRTRGIALTLRRAPQQTLRRSLFIMLITGLGLLLFTLSPLWSVLLLWPLVALLHVPYIIGLAALGDALSDALGLPVQPPSSAILGSGMLLLTLVLVGFVAPLFSVALFYLIGAYGVGALVLSRGGVGGEAGM
ncbi:MAG: hypothetical protein EI684_22950 [Candidatus Viridilinea halotolerans]|uniref:Uncharacterized protein n=1 Tax=Candidatus Viridilinea halotolerans TaxID=2491704 RepID=A0A426TQH9_9CHLR|nr:MAG: hypothetical protein EI684_22950 [Candidatus Viridilinea halotolerans]